jgi:hypothetical protein
MSEYLEFFLRNFDANVVTDAFVILIIGAFLGALYCRGKGRSNAYVSYTATLLTTLGILGTFTGIVVGLLDFDPNNLDKSIPSLLAGLKTAFITSLVGMFFSIVFKFLGTVGLFIKSEEDIDIGEVGANEIFQAIVHQGKLAKESADIQQELLTDLKQAIVGGEDDTLITQVKLMRGDMNDNSKKYLNSIQSMEENLATIKGIITEQQSDFTKFSDVLWAKLQDVADMISKSASEQVINALKQVITDFNKHLVEQFGDNFKALDESVKKLVVWQENYSKQIEQMVAQYALGVTAITQTKESVGIISDKAEHIPKTMADLQEVMTVNQHQIKELESHLEAFKDMRDKAVAAVPEIRQEVERTVTDIASSVQLANDHYKTLLTDSDQYIKDHVEASNKILNSFVKNTKEGIDAVKTGLVDSGNEVRTTITESSESFHTIVKETNRGLDETSKNINNQNIKMQEDLIATNEASTKHFEKLLGESGKAIEEVLKSFNTATNESIQLVKTGFDEGAKAIAKEVSDSSKVYLDTITEGANDYRDSVAATNDSLLKTSNEISKQSDIIKQHLEDTVSDLNSNVRDMVDKVVTETTSLGESLRSSNEKVGENINVTNELVLEQIKDMSQSIKLAMDDVFAMQMTEIKRTFKGLEDEVTRSVALTGEVVTEQAKIMEEVRDREVERVMTQMGVALTKISGRFTDDYYRLTDAMQKIVRANKNQ